jgi:hypothetical protein
MGLCADLISTKPAPECANLNWGDGEWHAVPCTALDDVSGRVKSGVCDRTGLCYDKCVLHARERERERGSWGLGGGTLLITAATAGAAPCPA